jgi:hypothetical protein
MIDSRHIAGDALAATWQACTDAFATFRIAGVEVPHSLRHSVTGGHDKPLHSRRFDGDETFAEVVRAWGDEPGADCCWVGPERGPLGATAMRLCVGLPHIGVFSRQRWAVAYDQEEICRARVAGIFQLAAACLALAQEPRCRARWPRDRRLALVDDGVQLPRWGWVQGRMSASGPLESDPSAYLHLLAFFRSLAGEPSARESEPAAARYTAPGRNLHELPVTKQRWREQPAAD